MFEEDYLTKLINQVLNESKIHETFIVIALDLQQPWTFMEDLTKWMGILTEAFAKVKLNLSALDDMRSRIEDYIRTFKEDEAQDEQNKQDDEEKEKQVKLPLREGVLKTNIGLPIMVVVNKSDLLEQAEKEKDWDNKFEVIQFSLRQFCIQCSHFPFHSLDGATLLFTSSKTNTNLNVFYEYILHRLYDFDFK